ncbi:hypothetical protein [Donghicola tyrosinivorans]|uniref:Uncharacterized protein n=1 Tax=Donghicola tyrosinivorans TaxID=1652492 RepID=A0A2T0X5M2_9RHOB|nr:hypothetical protein [Donghicola tyrosinivorans]PRY94252.1 hypothetical protein CLV74_101388 [Donghicola tyrosinivorans]
MKRALTVWKRHPLATAVFVGLLALVIFFGWRTFHKARDFWDHPIAENQPIQGWMTPRYVAESWHIDKPDMFQIMHELTDMPPPDGKPQPLDGIATAAGIPPQELIENLTAALQDYQSGKHD